jgi:hypothetical protein
MGCEPKCETKGCDLESRFHGFGHHFCWVCYGRWLSEVVNTKPMDGSYQINLSDGSQLELF